jgi:putative membrane protein
MTRSLKDYLVLFGKGILMGAADVVPGVSGGTIAFISGIYKELIDSIRSINPSVFKILKKEGITATWLHINGNFLVVLLLGILTSIASLAKGITYLLENHPVIIWAFFLGLIIASVVFIAKQITEWNISSIAALLIGTGIAYYITIAAPSQIPDGYIFIFLAGSIAICAMILPGISGSFILLLMGAYSTIIGSITNLIDALKAVNSTLIIANGTTLGVFAAGCIFGLLGFSHVLGWMFKKAHNITIALLTGFMIGSLNKVWPWKEVVQTRVNSHGEVVPFLDRNVSPGNYTELTGEPNHLIMALIAASFGFAIVFVLEKFSDKKTV